MPNMVPPDYGSNMKPEYWNDPNPDLEPVNPHIRPLNRYGTRKTQRKENIYGYTGGGDATPWEPVNYAGYRHYPCYYLSFPPEIASEPESSHHSDQGVVRKDTAMYGGRLRPPIVTDDPGLDVLEGTDSSGKKYWYENRPEEESFNKDGTKKPIKRWAYDPRYRTDWRNETAERTYPTFDWSRASGRAGGRDREFWRCVYKKRCSHEWKDWCAAKDPPKQPSVITPMSCRPEPLGWAQYEPQERKPHQCNRRVDCMDVAGVLLYTTSCLAAVFYVLGTPLLVNYLIQLTRAQ